MRSWFKSDVGILLQKILFVTLAFFIIRIVFLVANYNYFLDLESREILLSLFYATLFDLALLLPVSAPFILFAILSPLHFARFRKQVNGIFTFINFLLLFLAVCDNLYFSYTQHRINYALIYLVPQSFTFQLLTVYFLKGWYWILLLCLTGLIYRNIFKNPDIPPTKFNRVQKAIGVAMVGLACISAVRGFESRPLSPSSVLLYFPSKIIDLASNTGFNVLYSLYKGQKELSEYDYFTDQELDQKFTIFHKAKGNAGKPNIVLFVMESFAKDFLDKTSPFKAATPFLDSLMGKSLVFDKAYSNGNESTHGLVAILASLPPFMQLPYYHSQYHSVSINGIGKLLGSINYDTNFFLGDVDDSFGFRQFTHSLGITHYYSRKDFNDDRFYNGAWGIHDDHFFRYAVDVLSTKKNPFFAGIFNVSSHPPYIIPKNLRSRFTIRGQNAAQNSVSYVDYAYREFFARAAKESWFNQTVFIFIADHFLSPSDNKQVNAVNMNAIPFFIYSPRSGIGPSVQHQMVQQLDVLPTVLEIAGYSGKFMSFGKSVFDTTGDRFAVQRMGDIYQILDDEFALGFNQPGNEVVYLYNYVKDPGLKINLSHDEKMDGIKTHLETELKARMQRYNHAFLNNRLLY
ncbi:MAG: sulfatase-like hydrolase/transferase [Chitinophagaceae bacterium]